jgi:hypothetical protein
VTNAHDIFDNRPRYETSDKLIKVVETEVQTKYRTEQTLQNQVVWRTERLSADEIKDAGTFNVTTINAVNGIVIDSGNNVTISAQLKTTGSAGTIDINAVNTATIKGGLPEGADPSTVIAAPSVLSSQSRIAVTAQTLQVDDLSELTVTGANGQLQLTAATDLSFNGIAIGNQVALNAGTTLNLPGQIQSSGNITIQAGTAAGIGDITGAATTHLQATDSVTLSAGNTDGDINLPGAWIAGQTVQMTANQGSINNYNTVTQANGDALLQHGLVSANTLTLTAADALSVNLQAEQLTATGSSLDLITEAKTTTTTATLNTLGDLNLTALSNLALTTVTADEVTLTALGNVSVNRLTAAGDVAMNLLQGNLTVNANGQLTTPGALTLTLQGGATTAAGARVTAQSLTLTARDAVNLTTTVTEATLTGLADNAFTLVNTGNLILHPSQFNGGMVNLSTTGDLTLATLALLSDRPNQGITLTAGGQLQFEQIDAGDHYGRLTLTAGTRIRNLNGDDDQADIIANQAILTAGQGIDLQTDLAQLSAAVTAGSLRINNQSRRAFGLGDILATAGDIAISTLGTLNATTRIESRSTGTIELVSKTNDLVLNPVEGGDDNLLKSDTIILQATGQLVIDRRVELDANHLTLASGKTGIVEGAVQLPKIRTPDLTLELGSGSIIISPESFKNAGGETLNLDTVTLIARGNQITSGALAGYYRYRDINSGHTYYLDTAELEAETKVYQQVAGNLEQLSAEAVIALRLAPVLNMLNYQVREPQSGKYTFLGTNGREYYRDRPQDTITYTRQNVAGLYGYTVLLKNEPVPRYETVYSTEQDYRVFAQQNASQYGDVQVHFTQVDASQLGLTALMRQELAGGISLATPVGELKDPRDGFSILGDSIILKAQRDLGNISLADLTGTTVEVSSGASINLFDAPNTENLSLSSTGYFDTAGNFVGGQINTTGNFRLLADTLELNAFAGINVKVDAANITANVTGNGNLTIQESGSVQVSQAFVNNGNFSLTTGSAATLEQLEVNGSLSLTAGTTLILNQAEVSGSVTLGAGSTLALNQVEVDGNLGITTPGAVNLAQADIGGNLTVGTLGNRAGAVTVGQTEIGGNLSVAGQSTITVNTAAIDGSLGLTGDTGAIALSQVDVGSTLTLSSSGTVTLQDVDVSQGATLTANQVNGFASDGVVDLEAASLTMTLTSGVGGVNQPLETSVGTLSIVAGSAINLSNYGAMTVAGVRNTSGSIRLETHSPMTITSDITSNDAIVIMAGESVDAGDDLTIASGVTIRSQSSTVTLRAGDHLSIANGATVQAAQALTIQGDYTDTPSVIDAEGSVITLAGSLSGTTLSVFGGDDTDTINLLGTVQGTSLLLSGGDGDDVINLERTAIATTLRGGLGADVINLGNSAQSLSEIAGALTINTDDDEDTLNLYHQGNSGNNNLQVTRTNISGLAGMAHAITYSNVENLNIFLGAGNNQVNVGTDLTANVAIESLSAQQSYRLDYSTETSGVNLVLENGKITNQITGGSLLIDQLQALEILLGAGNDTVAINGALPLALTLSAGAGQDQLILDRSDLSTGMDGTLTVMGDRILGFGVDSSLSYSGFDILQLRSGSGADSLTLDNQFTGNLILETGGGNDSITVAAIQGNTILRAGAGVDLITLGTATQTLNAIQADLSIDGQGDQDTLQIDNRGVVGSQNVRFTHHQVQGLAGLGGNLTYDQLDQVVVKLGTGNDQVTMADHTLDHLLVVDAGAGTNQIKLDLAGNTSGYQGAVRVMGNHLVGLELTNRLIYQNLTLTEVQLGSGDDNILLLNQLTTDFNLKTGSGDDTVTLDAPTSKTTVATEAGNDTIKVRAIAVATQVDGGEGNDLIQIGDTSNTVDQIAQLLQVQGGAGNDELRVNDLGDTNQNWGTITGTTLNGFDMTGQVQYGTVEFVNLQLGSGQDVVTVAGTHTQKTQINTGAGVDYVRVQAIAGETTLNTEAGADQIVIANAQTTVNSIEATLTVNAGTHSDTLQVLDSGDITNNTGTLTQTQISGLGMTGTINYTNVDLVQVNLGAGHDQLTVASTHTRRTAINTGGGDDTVQVQAIQGLTQIATGDGDDRIQVGNAAHTANDIAHRLIVTGGAGVDSLQVDDSGETDSSSVVISNRTVSGLGMRNAVEYASIDHLNVTTGEGAATVSVQSTHQSVKTTVQTGAGDDRVWIRSAQGQTQIETGAGADQVVVQAIAAPTQINTGADDDRILVHDVNNTVNAIQAPLFLDGGEGNDTVLVRDFGDVPSTPATVGESQISGLGMGAAIQHQNLERIDLQLTQDETAIAESGDWLLSFAKRTMTNLPHLAWTWLLKRR